LRCHVNKPLRLRDDWVTSESALSVWARTCFDWCKHTIGLADDCLIRQNPITRDDCLEIAQRFREKRNAAAVVLSNTAKPA
jgi:hypothetical protein